MKVSFDWDEVNTLINMLHSQGISYLIGDDASVSNDNKAVEPIQLIQRIAACGYPLVENASIALFILHPDIAPSVVTVLERSTPDIAENIAVVTLATLYLQQWWFFRLTFALGRLPSFPETPFASLWQERHLPSPSVGYGMDGLLALQEYQQQRYNLPLNFLDDWQNQIRHLLTQEEYVHRPLPENLKQTLRHMSI